MAQRSFFYCWGLAIFYLLLIFLLSSMPLSAPQGSDWFFHLSEYLLLGIFVMRGARLTFPYHLKKALGLAFLLVLLVSALDETFHFILPYRDGSIKDFVFDGLGGVLGLTGFEILRKFLKKDQKLYPNPHGDCQKRQSPPIFDIRYTKKS